MDKRCVVCGINSTVLDGDRWVCAAHITPCKCKRNHDLLVDWDFKGVTVEDMEFQSPDVYEEEYMKRTHVTTKPLWVNLKQDKTAKEK